MLPLVELSSNIAPWLCTVTGTSLENRPDVVEWRTVIPASLGTVTVIEPDVVFAFIEDGIELLEILTLPDRLLAVTL